MLSFFAFGFFWHFMLQAKGASPTMERDDRSSLNLSVAKCRFFFVDSVHASFTSFVRLLRLWQSFLMATHHDQMTFTNQQTSTNSISTSKKLRNIVLLYGSSYIPCQLEKSHVFFLPLFFLGGFLFRSSGFGHEIDHVGPLLWRFLRSRHL